MAPLPPLLLPPPRNLPGPVLAFPHGLSDWLQEQASIEVRIGYEARWGVNYTPGSGLPLAWFNRDQQHHISAHRMDNTSQRWLSWRTGCLTVTRCWT